MSTVDRGALPRRDRRALLRRGGALVPLLGVTTLALDSALRPAAGAEAAALPCPLEGSWAVEIKFPRNQNIPVERGLFAFLPGGVIIETNTRARQPGMGSWRVTGSNRVLFGFRHLSSDGDGGYEGELRIRHDLVLTSGTTFLSSGTATSYDAHGNPGEVLTSEAKGVRYGAGE